MIFVPFDFRMILYAFWVVMRFPYEFFGFLLIFWRILFERRGVMEFVEKRRHAFGRYEIS
jgi:hypothetical protein